MTNDFPAPQPDEAAEYYFAYIGLVPAGDICDTLARQLAETTQYLAGISADQSLVRYASDKWSIREVVRHLSDTERLFAFRAFWFARGFDSPLPSFDQNVAMTSARAEEQSWDSLVRELGAVREASIALFRTLPAEAWDRRGVASGNEFSVRALAYLVAGHVSHHVAILREKYLPAAPV
jgi:hypothetical protein